jgi:WD40 repeat protein/tetratricopeptide (TPR) repeat protein
MSGDATFLDGHGAVLDELADVLDLGRGQFSLHLVRCRYAHLRSQLADALCRRCQQTYAFTLDRLTLAPSAQNLYTSIQAHLQTQGGDRPDGLMVFGLEQVTDLAAVLGATESVREEFRNHVPFPLVLWLDDAAYIQVTRDAPNFASWSAGTLVLSLSPSALGDALHQAADHLYSALVAPAPGSLPAMLRRLSPIGLFRLGELAVAVEEARAAHLALTPEAQAALDWAMALDLADRHPQDLQTPAQHFQRSVGYWTSQEPLEDCDRALRAGIAHFFLGRHLAWAIDRERRQGEEVAVDAWQQARHPLEFSIQQFQTCDRWDLVAKCLSALQRVLRRLDDWDALERYSRLGLDIHPLETYPLKRAYDYGFLGNIALHRQQWTEAQQFTQAALHILDDLPDESGWIRGLYLLNLAKAERGLGNLQGAIAYLLKARELGDRGHPTTYCQILDELRQIRIEQRQYVRAFRLKQARLEVEKNAGIRAFVGAGRLGLESQGLAHPTTVAPELEASGRRQDLERLMERLGRNDHKLIVIHGRSGVGKSSLLNAGLVPRLRRRIDYRDNAVVVMRQYTTHWQQDVLKQLQHTLEELRRRLGDGTLLQELRRNEGRNLRTILMFDQFEEFFFVNPDRVQWRQFFEWLGDCLAIPYVKVVLSLREDYIHYLLDANRLDSMSVIGHDILGRQVLYGLGNLSLADAQATMEDLTGRSRFSLEPALVERVVQDLGGPLQEVRPIEMQIVGARLQTVGVSTLAAYEQLGEVPKEVLVTGYVQEVVEDCGPEHQQLAELVLFLLTDERGTRPLKTRSELVQELEALLPGQVFGDGDAGLEEEEAEPTEPLDLVLRVACGSGLVMYLPEEPQDRYQLVHDYIAELIQRQQSGLLVAALAEERQQRQAAETERALFEDANRRANRRLRSSVLMLAVAAAALVFAIPAAILLAGIAREAVAEAAVARKNQGEAERAANEAAEELRSAEDQRQEAVKEASEAQDAVAVARQSLMQLEQQTQQEQAAAEAAVQQAEEQLAAAEQEQVRATAQVAQARQTLNEAIAQQRRAEAETQLAQAGTRLERAGVGAQQRFGFQETEELLVATRALSELKQLTQQNGITELVDYPAYSPWLATQTSVDQIRETRFAGHQGSVNQVVFSPAGNAIATGGADGTARLWDLAGNQLAVLAVHQGRVNQVVFSPDGNAIATGGDDGMIWLWYLDSDELIFIEGHEDSVRQVVFSPNGNTIATRGNDNIVRLWDLEGNEQAQIKGHEDGISHVAFSPHGNAIATSGEDGTARLWDLDGNQLAVMEGHEGSVYQIVFSPDGNVIATGSRDSTARLWDLNGEQLVVIEGHDGGVNHVVFSPDGNTIATGSWDSTARLWDLDGKELAVIEGHWESVRHVVFSPDGRALATSSWGTARLWDLNGKELAAMERHRGNVNQVVFSPDGNAIATGGDDGTARLWGLEGNELARIEGHEGSVSQVVFSPEGDAIATGGDDRTARLWDLDGNPLGSLVGHRGPVSQVVFSPDGRALATGSSDGTTWLWYLDSNELISMEGGGWVYHVVFSPDGRAIATGGLERTVRLWDLDGNQRAVMEGHDFLVHWIEFHPSGRVIATGGSDGTARLWDLNGNQLGFRGEENWGSILQVVFHPDGNAFATGSDGRAVLWYLDGNESISMEGHQGFVYQVVFSPDGNAIATGGADGTARLWDLEGNQLAVMEGHGGGVTQVLFSPDGDRIATSDNDTTRIWTLNGQQIAQYEGQLGTFAPDWSHVWIVQPGNALMGEDPANQRVTKWPVDQDIDSLLARACRRLRSYLIHSPNVTESDRAMCNIPPRDS